MRRLSELLRIFEDRDLRAVALFGSTYAQKLAGEVKEVRPDLLRTISRAASGSRSTLEPLNKGRFAKYRGVIQRNGWVASPIAGTLLSIVTGA